PAAIAAAEIWRPKLIADTSISDGILPKLIDGDIQTFGELDNETLQGDAPARLKRFKLNGEQISELLDLLEKAKADALAEVNKPKEQPQPEPSMGKLGYKFEMGAKLGRYGSSNLSCAVRATINIAGEHGVKGYRAGTVHRFLCGAQLDVEIGEGKQPSLEG